jgi:hypothetical protein
VPGKLLLEHEVENHIPGKAVSVERQHRRHAAHHNRVPYTVRPRPLEARYALARIGRLFQDLTALARRVLPRCLKRLGEGVTVPCLLVGGDAA